VRTTSPPFRPPCHWRLGGEHPLSARIAALLLTLVSLLAPSARADATYPQRPGQREFIADEAGLINPADQQAIKDTATKLLDDKGIPIVAVTITSLADHNAAGWTIDRYAHNLFDEWGIGAQARNYGILLLVSKGDRKARIEFGAGFTRERDQAAAQIMQSTIVPRFKQGDYSGGIRAGVEALDKIGRAQAIPLGGRAPPQSSGPNPTSIPAPPSSTAPSDGHPTTNLPTNSRPVAPSPPMSYRSSGSGAGAGLLICTAIPIILVVLLVVAARARRAIGGGYSGMGGYYGRNRGWGWGPGYGAGWGYGGYGGPWGWGSGWGSSGNTSSSSSWGGFGGGSGGSGFGGGGGGGYSSGSFGGGPSGGGGATGSW
jgi:uncharacterized membrane protein YgcG